MIDLLLAAEIYLASCTCATNPNQFQCVMVYKAGDPLWDESWPDEELEGGAYVDSSKAARDPHDRAGDNDGL